MKCYRINQTNYHPNFTSYTTSEINDFAYDDTIMQTGFDALREHYLAWNIPYQSIYERETKNPCVESCSKKIVTNIYKNRENVFKLPLINLRNISYSKKYQPNIFRGQTLADASDDCFSTLKSAGIRTVIDLAGMGENYKQKVLKNGMDFMSFDVDSYYYRDASADQTSRNYLDKFIKFICKMQEENIYIGCEYGTHKTDHAILLNKVFNPKIISEFCNVTNIIKPTNLMSLYTKFTKSDKRLMGWDYEFEKKVFETITRTSKFIH